MNYETVLRDLKPGFHLQRTERLQHQKYSDYVVEQWSIALIALFWLEIGRSRGRIIGFMKTML